MAVVYIEGMLYKKADLTQKYAAYHHNRNIVKSWEDWISEGMVDIIPPYQKCQWKNNYWVRFLHLYSAFKCCVSPLHSLNCIPLIIGPVSNFEWSLSLCSREVMGKIWTTTQIPKEFQKGEREAESSNYSYPSQTNDTVMRSMVCWLDHSELVVIFHILSGIPSIPLLWESKTVRWFCF